MTIDMDALQRRLVDQVRVLAPAVRVATLADAKYTERPCGIALAFPPSWGSRAYVQFIRMPATPGDNGAVSRTAPRPAPTFANAGDGPVLAEDVEALLALAAHAADPQDVLNVQRYSKRPTGTWNQPYGILVRYRQGVRVTMVPFLMLSRGQDPGTEHEFTFPDEF